MGPRDRTVKPARARPCEHSRTLPNGFLPWSLPSGSSSAVPAAFAALTGPRQRNTERFPGSQSWAFCERVRALRSCWKRPWSQRFARECVHHVRHDRLQCEPHHRGVERYTTHMRVLSDRNLMRYTQWFVYSGGGIQAVKCIGASLKARDAATRQPVAAALGPS